LMIERSAFAHTQLRLVTELPVFLALLNNSEVRADKATMDAMAAHYRTMLRAQACVISDIAGHTLGRDEQGTTSLLPDDLRKVAGAIPAAPSILRLGSDLYLVASQPAVYADEELGLMTAAYPIDDELAIQLAKATRTEVSFLAQARLISSSLHPAVRSAA